MAKESVSVQSMTIKFLALEIFFTAVLLLIIRLSVIGNLWDQTYFDYVIEDWQTKPIVDIKVIDAVTMGSSTQCPADYELIGQGWFPGTKAACKCQGDVRYSECSETEVQDLGCIDIKPLRESDLPVVHKKFYCAKREPSYNFMTTEKPKKVDDKWQCLGRRMTKLCGDVDSENGDRLFCIPQLSQCPVTKVRIDQDSNVHMSYRSEDGLPVINLVLSAGDGPCIFYRDYHNSAKDKVQMDIMESAYYNQECPVIEFEGKDYRIQNLFRKPGMPPVSEVEMYKDNKGGVIWHTLEKKMKIGLPDKDAFESQKWNMYEVSYHPWAYNCKNRKTNLQITKHVIQDDIYPNSYHLMRMAHAILWFVIFTIVLQVSEACALSLHIFDSISKTQLRYFAIFRRIFSIFVEVLSIILLTYMRVSIGKGEIHELALQDCAQDPIMQSAFMHMSNFRFSLGKKVWQCIGILIIVFFAELCGVIYKISMEGADKYQKMKARKEFLAKNYPDYLSNHSDTESESKWHSTQIK